MNKLFFLRIGTRTTTRKKSAIQAALDGRMQTRHLDDVMLRYRYALVEPVREFILAHYGTGTIIGFDPEEFALNCVKDAFVRIKEYDPKYRFRSFLVKKILMPELLQLVREAKKEKDAIINYLQEKETVRKLEENLDTRVKYALTKELVFDTLMKYKQDDPIKYEVFCMRYYEKLAWPEILKEVKKSYPALVITSADGVRKMYDRAEKELKHTFREIIRTGKYLDRDLILSKGIMNRLRAETTKSK
ncbi:MAG: hypothetical protein HY762_01320 [Planctomycetes bacterium]|nr:hypothetical protein [Planctomycetota bacterium]